jgi:hypothetical protein
MKYILSRYNHDIEWVKGYTDDVVLYDRSEVPIAGSIVVPNIGSDIYDKLTFIIEHYDNLPDVALYSKANLFKYITREEFDGLKDNRTFTPLLTQQHKTYMPVCRYAEDGLYEELNNYWYLNHYPTKNKKTVEELKELLTFNGREYLKFAPGSNYILSKEDILRHPKNLYKKLRDYLSWGVYPGEAQMLERSLYYLWGTNEIKS